MLEHAVDLTGSQPIAPSAVVLRLERFGITPPWPSPAPVSLFISMPFNVIEMGVAESMILMSEVLKLLGDAVLITSCISIHAGVEQICLRCRDQYDAMSAPPT